ncbi:MAG: transposase [Kiritimatiellia bacterium]|nr:transposase [Lentisphaerota bacterium]
MPRKPRIEYAGAVYHVMCRGDRRESVFRDDRDHESFIETLGEACGRCGWVVHAYVLMANHYHMLLETPEANLVAGMQWLQGTYTTRFNVRHSECGHLFQGRYKSLLVSPEGQYFSVVADYIHLNPARIKGYDFTHRRLEDHRWSSYPSYVGRVKRTAWLCVDRVMAGLGLSDTLYGRRKYARMMREKMVEMSGSDEPWLVEELWRRIRRGWCVGGESFREEMEGLLGGALRGRRRDSYSGEDARRHDEIEAERLIGIGLEALGIGEDVLSSQAKGSELKYSLAWLVRRHTCVRNGWIKARLVMGTATNFASMLSRFEKSRRGEWGYTLRKRLEIINL